MIYRSDLARELTHDELDANFKACLGVHNLLHVQDRKAAGTHGGTFTTGAWRKRDLNHIARNTIFGASLEGSQITLPIGIYYCEGFAPCFLNGAVVAARLFNVTSALEVLPSNVNATSGSGSLWGAHNSIVSGYFEISEASVLELQHYSSVTYADTGFGAGSAIGQSINIYSDLKIWKVA